MMKHKKDKHKKENGVTKKSGKLGQNEQKKGVKIVSNDINEYLWLVRIMMAWCVCCLRTTLIVPAVTSESCVSVDVQLSTQ